MTWQASAKQSTRITQVHSSHMSIPVGIQGQPDTATMNSPGHDAQPRRPNKRARQACLSCRFRKVRCDVSTCSPPCTNCKMDKIECVTKPRLRKWFVNFVCSSQHIYEYSLLTRGLAGIKRRNGGPTSRICGKRTRDQLKACQRTPPLFAMCLRMRSLHPRSLKLIPRRQRQAL